MHALSIAVGAMFLIVACLIVIWAALAAVYATPPVSPVVKSCACVGDCPDFDYEPKHGKPQPGNVDYFGASQSYADYVEGYPDSK